MTDNKGLIPSLDGLRAIAVLLVFAGHCHISGLIPGGFGVTIFFFLSGYLITTLLAREYDRNSRISLTKFYLRRLLRLSPPLLITMACAFGLHLAGLVGGQIDLGTVLSQIFYYYNYWSLHFGPISGGGPVPFGQGDTIPGMGIYWSLSVEEHFYLIWPLLFLAIARNALTIKHVSALIAVVLVWRSVRHFVFEAEAWTIYTSTDTRIDMLLFGCLLALLSWKGFARRLAPKGRGKYIVLAASVLAILASFVIRDETFRATFRFSIQGLALMPIFYYAVNVPKEPLFRALNWSVLRRVGTYSYTIYLSHYVIILLLVEQSIATLGTVKMVFYAGVLTLMYSAAMYAIVERPILKLRHRLAA